MLWIKERKRAKVSETTEAMVTTGLEVTINLNSICYNNLHIQYDLQSAPYNKTVFFLCVLSNEIRHSCPEQSHTSRCRSRKKTLTEKEKSQGIGT